MPLANTIGVSSFKEVFSSKGITASGDTPVVIDLSGRVFTWGQSKMDADTCRDLRKRLGSSMVVLKANAVRGPTPGTVMNRRQVASLRTRRPIRRVNTRACSPSMRRANDQLAYTLLKAALADKAHFESEGSKCRPNMIVEVALLVE
jgi:hypothetical protein